MGGGIAFQSALKGVPILMKDIAEAGLQAGIAEADAQLVQRVERGQYAGGGNGARAGEYSTDARLSRL